MDLETIFYIAMFILFSVFSGAANRKKKKAEGEQQNEGTTLEEEIRRMQEQILGKRETQDASERPAPTQRPVSHQRYETLEDDQEETRRYRRNERENYSQEEIISEEQPYEAYKTSYKTLEDSYAEASNKGKDLHSVMDKVIYPADRFDHSDIPGEPIEFDARKAIIFSEILRRPEY